MLVPLPPYPAMSTALAEQDDTARRSRPRQQLRKTQAVHDDDGVTGLLEAMRQRPASFDAGMGNTGGTRLSASGRPSSFDTAHAAVRPPVAPRPSSFDVPSRLPSAFSPVEVPRLLVHSPVDRAAPSLQVPPHASQHLLRVPSPDSLFRKLPASPELQQARSPLGDMSAASDLLSLGINPGMFGQLSALALGLDRKALSQQPSTEGEEEGVGGISNEVKEDELQKAMFNLQHQFSASAGSGDQLPPKSVIQEIIRKDGGRFQLVRKRGRSEVWNLFGQVLDTTTGVRLPYVACYACRVLYTDTGGGTGNMTRHRCPIGNSYRSSVHGSSAEGADGLSVTPQLSFESTTSAITQRERVGRSTTPEVKPLLHLSIANESPVSTSEQVTPQPQQQQQLPQQVSVGENDREPLADAIVRASVTDLLDPTLFYQRGMSNLMRRLLYSGRCHSDSFPELSTVQKTMESMQRFARQDMHNELSQNTSGVCVCVERLRFDGSEFDVVWASRITPEWRLRKSVIGVRQADTEPLGHFIAQLCEEYGINLAKTCVVAPTMDEEWPVGMKVLPDMRRSLEAIVNEVVKESGVLDSLRSLVDLTKWLSAKGFCDHLPKLANLLAHDPFTYVTDVYVLLSTWTINAQSIVTRMDDHREQLSLYNSLDWPSLNELETFLEPFHETSMSLEDAPAPNFHQVLPECLALIHECSISEDDSMNAFQKKLRACAHDMLTRHLERYIGVDQRIAALLNPRLNRRLGALCSEHERADTFARIRELCGINVKEEQHSGNSSLDGEPNRKRRTFLSSLEEGTATDDELECYTRSQFPSHQSKDVLTFWSTVGRSQFPQLARLARRLLATPASAPRSSCGAAPSVPRSQLHTYLILRSMFDSERDDSM